LREEDDVSRSFLSIDDLSEKELGGLLEDAAAVKKKPSRLDGALEGRVIAFILEKPSTRTRISFEAAIDALGGHAIVLRGDELQLGRGETIEDTGRVLERLVDAIVVRTFGQDRLERLADSSGLPVVNALSDYSHPTQGLADLMTIQEQKGDLQGVVLGYLGDGNNVVHSLLLGGAKLGMEVRVATPPGFEPLPAVTARAQEIAAQTGGKIAVGNVVAEAATGADVLYTDVWASMGQEEEAEERRKMFSHYQLNQDVVDLATEDAIVMHCLPAHRGEEITADVLDGPRSVVWDQAENKLHCLKALLAWLFS
jgi:ornithine carbamoyltransferase